MNNIINKGLFSVVCVLIAGDARAEAKADHGTPLRADTEYIWIDRSGRAVVGEAFTATLENEDAEPVALTVNSCVSGADDQEGILRAVQGNGLAMQLISNGFGDEGDTPTDVVFTPDGDNIIVVHRDSQNLTVFDAETRDVLDSIAVSGSPNAIAVTPDGTQGVTANIFEDTASIVDLVTGMETAVIPVGDQPGVVRISPDGSTAVVGNTVSGSLSLIDIATAMETNVIGGVEFSSSTSINFETGVVVSRFSPFEFADNDTVVLPERFNSRVQFVDIRTGEVSPLLTAANPTALDVSPDGTTAVVCHGFDTQLVSVIDVAFQTVSATIPTGVDLNSGTIAINPSKTKAVVGVLNEVRIVNLIDETVTANIFTAGLYDLAVTSDGHYCLAVGYNGALISFDSESVVANLNLVVSTNLGAASPTEPRAALVGSLFTEEMLVVNTDGSNGFLEERVPSGPPPEGDKARHAVFAPDGTQAVVVNILSDTVSLIDPNLREVQNILEVGDRPSEAEITPDSALAAVANLDSTFLSVIDLNNQMTSSVNISTRASQVEISPDGQYAYVAVVASGDGVWRVDLSTLTVDGPRIFTGNMGGIFFLYQQTSGMTLSHDGTTLVTCNSFDDNISIIDTARWEEIVRLPVGDFPVQAVFSPDDTRIYVSNKDGGTVSVVANAGDLSQVIGTINVGDQPFDMDITPDGSRLFIANFASATVSIVDLPGTTVNDTVFLNEPIQDIELNAAGSELYAVGGNWSVSIGPGPVVTLNQSGEFSIVDTETGAVLDQLTTGLPPGMLAVRQSNPLAMVPSPHGDGVGFITLPSCPGDSDGNGAVDIVDLLGLLAAWGSDDPAFDIAPEGGDGNIDIQDLLALLAVWGACT